MSDTIGDFLIRIKNGAAAGKKTVSSSYSCEKESLAKVLQEEGFLQKSEVYSEDGKKSLILTLKEEKGEPKKIEVKRISKPGRRVYSTVKAIRQHKRGLGTIIVSTSKGILTDKKAIAQKIGGELLCKII